MVVSIRVNGINDIITLTYKLDNKRVEKAVTKAIKNNMSIMQKKMKLRAQSRRSTGHLANSIKLSVTKAGVLLDIDAYYAEYLIAGFREHVVPGVYLERHNSNPSVPQSKKSASTADIKRYGFTTVKHKQSDDFFTPVYKEQVEKIDADIAVELEQHLAGAR